MLITYTPALLAASRDRRRPRARHHMHAPSRRRRRPPFLGGLYGLEVFLCDLIGDPLANSIHQHAH